MILSPPAIPTRTPVRHNHFVVAVAQLVRAAKRPDPNLQACKGPRCGRSTLQAHPATTSIFRRPYVAATFPSRYDYRHHKPVSGHRSVGGSVGSNFGRLYKPSLKAFGRRGDDGRSGVIRTLDPHVPNVVLSFGSVCPRHRKPNQSSQRLGIHLAGFELDASPPIRASRNSIIDERCDGSHRSHTLSTAIHRRPTKAKTSDRDHAGDQEK